MRFMRIPTVALAVFCLIMAGCSKGDQKNDAVSGNGAEIDQVIIQISSPDEGFQALSKFVSKSDLQACIDGNTKVEGSDRAVIAYTIGRQAANAALAELTGDAQAKPLADSLKDLAAALNIKTDTLESLIAKLAKDFEEKDAKVQERSVRRDLVSITREIKISLDAMGNGNESTFVLFGGWVEGLRVLSTVLSKTYLEKDTRILNRIAEINYFLPRIQKAAEKGDAYAARFVLGLSELKAEMQQLKDNVYSLETVKAINAKAISLAAVSAK